MDFLTIKNSTHPSLEEIQKLYEDAFPLRERRDFSALLDLLVIENMELKAINDFSLIIGFLIQWEFKSFNYIEHLAIDPSQRGKNYGTKVMKKIIGNSDKILLLEVEPPHDDISNKRILFYEKLGMKVCPFTYEQPPYREDEKSFPMLIMSFPIELKRSAFEEFTSIITTEVYDRWR